MRWIPVLIFAVRLLVGAEPAAVPPIDALVEIIGYRLAGDDMLAVIRVTNRESTPIYHIAHAEDRPIIRLSWQVDEAWVEERLGVCGVGLDRRYLAAGAQREYTWRVGHRRPGSDLQAGTWTWIPASWPIRAGIRFHRDATADWWDALSEPAGIDETLRPVMLQAVGARETHDPVPAPVAAVPGSLPVRASPR